MAQTRRLKNSQVLAMFLPSATTLAMVRCSGFEKWPIFSMRWYLIVFVFFLHFLYFLQSGRHSLSVHFMNIITHSASPSPPPSPPLNHTANFTHHLTIIWNNNPFPSPRQGPNKWGSLLRTDAFLIFPWFLETWTEITALTITNSLSLTLREVAYN